MADRTFLNTPIVDSWAIDSIESVQEILDRGGRRYTYVDEDSQRWLLTLPTLPDWMGRDGNARRLLAHRFRTRQQDFTAEFPQMLGVNQPNGVQLAEATAKRDKTVWLKGNGKIDAGTFVTFAGDPKVYLLCEGATLTFAGVNVHVFPWLRTVRARNTALDFSPQGTFKYPSPAIRSIRHQRGNLQAVTVNAEESL